jgi:hypothetical protein
MCSCGKNLCEECEKRLDAALAFVETDNDLLKIRKVLISVFGESSIFAQMLVD